MAIHHGPTIPGISANRDYYLDPALEASYNVGTTAFNLASSPAYNVGNTLANLTNGTQFSQLGAGSFYFDGTNDQIRYDLGPNTSAPLLLPTISTVYAWLYPLASTGAIFSHWSGGPVNLGYHLEGGRISVAQYWSDWRYYSSSGPTVPTNTWSQVAWVRSSSTSMSLYLNDTLNGTLVPDTGAGQFFGGGNNGVVGSLWGWKFFNGYLGVFMIYSEAHTLAKVQQTFNMYRSRYGV
jgi:hypothetical protein